MGKSTINGPFSMAMLNNQRVICFNHRPEISTLMSKSLDWFSRSSMGKYHENGNPHGFPSWKSKSWGFPIMGIFI